MFRKNILVDEQGKRLFNYRTDPLFRVIRCTESNESMAIGKLCSNSNVLLKVFNVIEQCLPDNTLSMSSAEKIESIFMGENYFIRNIAVNDDLLYAPVFLLVYFAIQYNCKFFINLLVKYGVYLNVVSKMKMTPMHFAVQEGACEMILYLRLSGVCVNVRNASGISPLILALACDNWHAAYAVLSTNEEYIDYEPNSIIKHNFIYKIANHDYQYCLSAFNYLKCKNKKKYFHLCTISENWDDIDLINDLFCIVVAIGDICLINYLLMNNAVDINSFDHSTIAEILVIRNELLLTEALKSYNKCFSDVLSTNLEDSSINSSNVPSTSDINIISSTALCSPKKDCTCVIVLIIIIQILEIIVGAIYP